MNLGVFGALSRRQLAIESSLGDGLHLGSMKGIHVQQRQPAFGREGQLQQLSCLVILSGPEDRPLDGLAKGVVRIRRLVDPCPLAHAWGIAEGHRLGLGIPGLQGLHVLQGGDGHSPTGQWFGGGQPRASADSTGLREIGQTAAQSIRAARGGAARPEIQSFGHSYI